MRHVRTLTLCLVAMLALAAFGGSVAWAKEKLPAWGQCEPVSEGTGGKYGNAGCTAPVKKVKGHYLGGYEWHPLVESKRRSDMRYVESESSEHPQPVSESTITFSGGQKITCGPLSGESEILLTGPTDITKAPYLLFSHCADSEGGSCHGIDVGAGGEISTEAAYYRGEEEEPGTWKGATVFVEGKNTADPTVGLVYETEHSGERMFQQIVCNGEHPLTIVIGGHKPGEQLPMTITPVNVMSESFTASFRQSNGVQLPARLEGHRTKPLEAQVNLGEWETVGFETTMLYPSVEPNENTYDESSNALELKATP